MTIFKSYPVNLQDVRKGLSELREGLKRIKGELGDRITDINPNDRYYTQMFEFVAKANSRVEDLVDNVNLAETSFTKVVRLYGEEDRNMTTSEFYAIFKTFVTSYKVGVAIANCVEPLTSVISILTRNAKLTTSMHRTSGKLRKSESVPPRRPKPAALRRERTQTRKVKVQTGQS
jgi:hypothetical protein